MGEAGLELKVDVLGLLWNARAAFEVVLGACFMMLGIANGRRSMNAMSAVLGFDDLEVQDEV